MNEMTRSEEIVFELSPFNIMLMIGVFVLVSITFIICIRRELK